MWNLSEVSYDGLASIEFKFPGHPSAPLGALFELCASLDSWLDADPANVAAIHCISGKGRTLAIIACYLTWIGQFVNPGDALAFCCEKKVALFYLFYTQVKVEQRKANSFCIFGGRRDFYMYRAIQLPT